MIKASLRIDGALLDVNVRGEKIFPVAEALAKRQVPFVFTTGHDQSALPESYRHIPHCEKPVDMSVMVSMIGRALKG